MRVFIFIIIILFFLFLFFFFFFFFFFFSFSFSLSPSFFPPSKKHSLPGPAASTASRRVACSFSPSAQR